MPIPKPEPLESKPHFMERCMRKLATDYPQTDQRAAICEQSWRQAKSKKKGGGR